MQSSAKISCMTTSFDDKSLELRAFPNGFMSGESKTVIEGIKVQENTMVIARAFDFEKNNLPSNIVKEIEKNQKKFARNANELSNIQRRIDDLKANRDNDSIEK